MTQSHNQPNNQPDPKGKQIKTTLNLVSKLMANPGNMVWDDDDQNYVNTNQRNLHNYIQSQQPQHKQKSTKVHSQPHQKGQLGQIPLQPKSVVTAQTPNQSQTVSSQPFPPIITVSQAPTPAQTPVQKPIQIQTQSQIKQQAVQNLSSLPKATRNSIFSRIDSLKNMEAKDLAWKLLAAGLITASGIYLAPAVLGTIGTTAFALGQVAGASHFGTGLLVPIFGSHAFGTFSSVGLAGFGSLTSAWGGATATAISYAISAVSGSLGLKALKQSKNLTQKPLGQNQPKVQTTIHTSSNSAVKSPTLTSNPKINSNPNLTQPQQTRSTTTNTKLKVNTSHTTPSSNKPNLLSNILTASTTMLNNFKQFFSNKQKQSPTSLKSSKQSTAQTAGNQISPIHQKAENKTKSSPEAKLATLKFRLLRDSYNSLGDLASFQIAIDKEIQDVRNQATQSEYVIPAIGLSPESIQKSLNEAESNQNTSSSAQANTQVDQTNLTAQQPVPQAPAQPAQPQAPVQSVQTQSPSQTVQAKQAPAQQAQANTSVQKPETPVASQKPETKQTIQANQPEVVKTSEFTPTPEQWNDLHDVLSKNYPIQIFEPGHLAPTTSGMYGSNEDYTQGQNYPTKKSEGIKVAEKLKTAETVVLGDLHASSLKLLETLVMSEMVYLPADKAKRFMEVYISLGKVIATIGAEGSNLRYTNYLDNKTGADRRQLSRYPEFSAELTDAQFPGQNISNKLKQGIEELTQIVHDIQWVGGSRKLKLLGDVIVDRGLSDSTTLRILMKITMEAEKQGYAKPFDVLASNHDWWYIVSDPNLDLSRIPTDYPSYPTMLATESKEWVKNVMKWYFADMKFFDYDEKTDSFYSHAQLESDYTRSKWFGILKIILGFTPDECLNAKVFVERANMYLKHVVERELEDQTQTTNPHSFDKHLDAILKFYPNMKLYITDWNNEYKQLGLDPQTIQTLISRKLDVFLINKLVWDHGANFTKSTTNTLNTIHGHDGTMYNSKYANNKAGFNNICLDNPVRKYSGVDNDMEREDDLPIYLP